MGCAGSLCDAAPSRPGSSAAVNDFARQVRSASVPWSLITTAILRCWSTLGNIAHGDFATMRVWTVAPSREWKRPVGALTLAALWFVRSGGSLDTNQRTSPDGGGAARGPGRRSAARQADPAGRVLHRGLRARRAERSATVVEPERDTLRQHAPARQRLRGARRRRRSAGRPRADARPRPQHAERGRVPRRRPLRRRGQPRPALTTTSRRAWRRRPSRWW